MYMGPLQLAYNDTTMFRLGFYLCLAPTVRDPIIFTQDQLYIQVLLDIVNR